MSKLHVLVFAIGVAVMLFQTVYDSNGLSYLSDNPEACVNCHNMRSAYNSWRHSSHGRDTNCNSCHVPHDSVFKKYLFKGMDGARHATMFTLRLEPQNLVLNEAAKDVVQSNCIRCHGSFTEDLNHPVTENRLCWDCHSSVPHGKLRSISAQPLYHKDSNNK